MSFSFNSGSLRDHSFQYKGTVNKTRSVKRNGKKYFDASFLKDWNENINKAMEMDMNEEQKLNINVDLLRTNGISLNVLSQV